MDSDQLGELIDQVGQYVSYASVIRLKFIEAGWTESGAETMTLELLRGAVQR